MVCRGNICRSTMAQAYFAKQLAAKSVTVISAGLSALVDHPADKTAQQVMSRIGIDLSMHRAKQVTQEIIKQAALVLVMSYSQLLEIEKKFLLARGKTFLLGHWQGFEVEDPYMQVEEIFERVYKKIVLAWVD